MPTRAETATKRRGRGPLRASPTVSGLISDYRRQLAIARKCYVKADEILQTLRAKLGIGRRVAIGGGLYAGVVDVFEAGDLIWKHQAVRRYDLKITDEDGKEARLRDRVIKAKPKAKPKPVVKSRRK